MEVVPKKTTACNQRIRTGKRVILAQCAAVAAVIAMFHCNTVWHWWKIVLANVFLLLITLFVQLRLCRPGRITTWICPFGWAAGVLPVIAYSLLAGQGSGWIVLLAVVMTLFFLPVSFLASVVLSVVFLLRKRTKDRFGRDFEEEIQGKR